MVFYFERAAGFAREYGMDDPGYLDALVRMFEQALKVSVTLADAERDAMLNRLDAVRVASRDFGYGVGYATCMSRVSTPPLTDGLFRRTDCPEPRRPG